MEVQEIPQPNRSPGWSWLSNVLLVSTVLRGDGDQKSKQKLVGVGIYFSLFFSEPSVEV